MQHPRQRQFRELNMENVNKHAGLGFRSVCTIFQELRMDERTVRGEHYLVDLPSDIALPVVALRHCTARRASLGMRCQPQCRSDATALTAATDKGGGTHNGRRRSGAGRRERRKELCVKVFEIQLMRDHIFHLSPLPLLLLLLLLCSIRGACSQGPSLAQSVHNEYG